MAKHRAGLLDDLVYRFAGRCSFRFKWYSFRRKLGGAKRPLIRVNRCVPLSDYLDQLSAFEPTPLPVISLYLNAQPDQHGRDNFEPFVRKEFAAVARTFESRSPERRSFEADAERIRAYLKDDVKPSSNGLAIFACAGKDEFFVPVQFDAPIGINCTLAISRIFIHWRKSAISIAATPP